MSSFSTYNQVRLSDPRPRTSLRSRFIAPFESPSDNVKDSDSQQLERELASLQARQRALQNRLTTLQRQQMHENMGRSTRSVSPSGVPDALEMIIYGLREELDRVVEQILLIKPRI